MTKVINLLTEQEQYYGNNMTPEQAVKMSYALENGITTQAAVQGIDALNLTVLRGKHTVSCGDWCARI